MENIIFFNIENEQSIRSLSRFRFYGKVNGLLLALNYRLPVSREGFLLINQISNIDLILKNLNYDLVMCRPDAPIGEGNYLPRGRDLQPEKVNLFLLEVQKIHKSGIVLGFKHPSVELTGRYIPRYKTSGSVVIIFNVGDCIIFEHVGPGFDAGDITRGKAAHNCLVIPWKDRFEKPSEIFRLARINMFPAFHVNHKQYMELRENRIKELLGYLGENLIDDILASIPLQSANLDFNLFLNIYNNCVQKLIYSETLQLGNNFGMILNMYGNKIHVFEIWKIERSNKNLKHGKL